MQEKLKLSKNKVLRLLKKQRMQNIPYASAIGSIMYAVRCTRPDVAFAQNMTSRFQQNPVKKKWTAVKNILKYLANSKDMFWYMEYKNKDFATSFMMLKYIVAFDASKEAVWIRKFISGLNVVPTIEEPINDYLSRKQFAPVAPPGQQVPPVADAAHAAWLKGKKEVAMLMLLTMDLDI
ncbi:hypothetical protein Tco_0911212 [Tanacetum coccineum]|uniref:Zinc finger, CCHC-type n=1 Tax=Tanacetum coccineum TaxID=301880 RepID=A0ABQ5CWS1_9ASTR